MPSTATTTLHALTGMTPSTGALWLPSLVGRSLTSGNPASGMHMPLAEPSASTTTPQAVTGTKASAASPCWVAGIGLLRAVCRAVPVDLRNHVTHGDRDLGIDDARLGRGSARPGGVAVARRVPDETDVDRADAHGCIRVDGSVLRCGRRGLTAESERGGCLLQQADGVVLRRDRGVDVRDATGLVQTDGRRRTATAGVGGHTHGERTDIDRRVRLATGEACPVVFVPVGESWLGSGAPPSSFDRTVIGAAADAGSVGSGSDAGPGGVGVADPDASATAAAAAFCTACTVVCRSVDVDVDDDAAPAGMTPTPAPGADRQQESRMSALRWKRICSASCPCSFSGGDTHPCSRSLAHTRRNENPLRSMRRCSRFVIAHGLHLRPLIVRGEKPDACGSYATPRPLVSFHARARRGATKRPVVLPVPIPWNGGSTGSASLPVADTRNRCPIRTARSAPRACARRSACTPPDRFPP